MEWRRPRESRSGVWFGFGSRGRLGRERRIGFELNGQQCEKMSLSKREANSGSDRVPSTFQRSRRVRDGSKTGWGDPSPNVWYSTVRNNDEPKKRIGAVQLSTHAPHCTTLQPQIMTNPRFQAPNKCRDRPGNQEECEGLVAVPVWANGAVRKAAGLFDVRKNMPRGCRSLQRCNAAVFSSLLSASPSCRFCSQGMGE